MAAETSLFTLNAQVYALDKNQKWTPLTQEIVPVTFLHSELTGNTRILAMDGGVTVVNSTIMPNMQYRRPAETFVQWFDSQHILYGLNLTSAADGDGFVKEFEVATGKQTRKASANAVKRSGSNTVPVSETTPSLSRAGRADSVDKTADAFAKTSIKSSEGSAADAKAINQLKTRLKELELQNVTLEADKAKLNETIASQTKTISSLQNQVQTLEADIDKLKVAFQQNASNVSIWKQQLQTYQDVNDQLSAKMNELSELYEKFGEILKRV